MDSPKRTPCGSGEETSCDPTPRLATSTSGSAGASGEHAPHRVGVRRGRTPRLRQSLADGRTRRSLHSRTLVCPPAPSSPPVCPGSYRLRNLTERSTAACCVVNSSERQDLYWPRHSRPFTSSALGVLLLERRIPQRPHVRLGHRLHTSAWKLGYLAVLCTRLVAWWLFSGSCLPSPVC